MAQEFYDDNGEQQWLLTQADVRFLGTLIAHSGRSATSAPLPSPEVVPEYQPPPVLPAPMPEPGPLQLPPYAPDPLEESRQESALAQQRTDLALARYESPGPITYRKPSTALAQIPTSFRPNLPRLNISPEKLLVWVSIATGLSVLLFVGYQLSGGLFGEKKPPAEVEPALFTQ